MTMNEAMSGVSFLVMLIMIAFYFVIMFYLSKRWIGRGYTARDIFLPILVISTTFFIFIMLVMVIMNGTLCINGVPVTI